MRRSLSLPLLAVLLLLSGCMRGIAPYDATLDATMTQVQQNTENFFSKLQFADPASAGSYAATKDFYQSAEPTLRTMLTRARAVPRSQLIADQIENILAATEKLRTTHERDGTLNPTLIDLERQAMESQFRSFFALELVLKSRPAAPLTGALAPALQP